MIKEVMTKEVIIGTGVGLGIALGFIIRDIAGGIVIGMVASALMVAAMQIWKASAKKDPKQG